MGAHMNPQWDDALARRRIDELDLDLGQRAGTLSGGQRAQLALTLAVAKRPEFLVLDEPVASLDPLARREFLQSLMEVVVEHGVSVLLSSHLVADLERVCDYLVVLVSSRVQVAGEVDELLTTHHRLSGPLHDTARSRRTCTSLRSVTPTGRARCSCAATGPCWTRRGRSRTSASRTSSWPTWAKPGAVPANGSAVGPARR